MKSGTQKFFNLHFDHLPFAIFQKLTSFLELLTSKSITIDISLISIAQA